MNTSTLRSLLVMLLMCFAAPSWAHDVAQSYVFFTIENQSVTGRVELTSADLNNALLLTLAEDSSLSVADLEPHQELIEAYYRERIQLAVNGQPVSFEFTNFHILPLSFGQFVSLDFTLTPTVANPEEIQIHSQLLFDVDEDHRSLVVIENHWESGTLNNEAVISLTFGPDDDPQILDLRGGSVLQGLWGFIQSGTHHIWIGLDHILFLIALLLPSVMIAQQNRWVGAPEFKDALWRVLKIVTVFTIAHSVTLSAAALGVFDLSSRVVESIIALSIGVAAVSIFRPSLKTSSLWVVLAFGLFHGFGFASVMGDLRIPDEYLVWSLLGFNIGVELGQIAIVIVVVPILFALRNTALYQRWVMPLGACFLILVSIYWLVERIFDINIPVKRYIPFL